MWCKFNVVFMYMYFKRGFGEISDSNGFGPIIAILCIRTSFLHDVSPFSSPAPFPTTPSTKFISIKRKCRRHLLASTTFISSSASPSFAAFVALSQGISTKDALLPLSDRRGVCVSKVVHSVLPIRGSGLIS